MNPGGGDPFELGNAALRRDAGHLLPLSEPKRGFLLPPARSTGVPLGGIGTGGIMRGSDGRFSRWTIKGGGMRQFDFPANGFILRVKPEGEPANARALQPRPDSNELSAFVFEEITPGWQGLYPFAVHKHEPLCGILAECKSFSPIIMGDLCTASEPVALFRWRLVNHSAKTSEVSLAFHFANMNGFFSTLAEGRPQRTESGCFNSAGESEGTVVLDRRKVGQERMEGDGQWAIAIDETKGSISRTICFDGFGDGRDFWNRLLETGDAPNCGQGWMSEGGFREASPALPTACVTNRLSLAPGESIELDYALAWDLPVVEFGQGRRWRRAHTSRYGTQGCSAERMALNAIEKAEEWENAIGQWHDRIADDLGNAPHRAGMAVNELYFLSDGLSFLGTRDKGSVNDKKGSQHFGIIECPDYALYNTMDLWVYASDAIRHFSPTLSASVIGDYAKHLTASDLTPRRLRYEADTFALNPAGTCPHDLGAPGEDPFILPNSYTHRDPTRWKDLNCNFVLTVWREWHHQQQQWRDELFPVVRSAIDHLQQFDHDGDGLIENDGTPDQTFDNIPMKGPSAYCGGLWTASLLAAARMAKQNGETQIAASWTAQAERAKGAFTGKLFNGTWFNVDTEGPMRGACFIEQLFGPFLARRYGLGDIVAPEHAKSALLAIFENNFQNEGGGEGAVSLALIKGEGRNALPDKQDGSFQTSEIQPGFNFSFAAQLEEWGLREEADTLRRALYHQLYEARNLAFQTPAAFDRGEPTCRAIMNMRPLSIWWMT